MPGRRWTNNEIEYLTAHYAEVNTVDIATRMGRSIKSVYQKAKDLGLHKSAEYLRKHVYVLGKNTEGTRFKKGCTPWNKGVRFIAGGKSADTRFRKGNLPHNTIRDEAMPVRRRKDGYLYIRIGIGKWVELHRWVYEKTMYVKLGPDDVIKFRNGDCTDVRIENLYRTDRKGNMLQNSIHNNYPPDVVRLISTLGKLNKLIKNGKSKQRNSHPDLDQ